MAMVRRHTSVMFDQGKKKSMSRLAFHNTINVQCKEAKGVPKMDIIGLSDPYCEIKLDKKVVERTPTIWKSLTPFWGQDYQIPATADFQELTVICWDEDNVGSDDVIGKVIFSADDLKDHNVHEQWYTLLPANSERQRITGHLNLEMFYQPAEDGKDGKLTVNVLEATDLAAKDANGLSDPYTKLSFNGKTQKTKTHKKTLNPKFNERFEWAVPADIEKDTPVVISVWDWDRLSASDKLGGCSVFLDQLTPNEVHNSWYMLSPLLTKKELKAMDAEGDESTPDLGTIRLRVEWVQEAVLPPSEYNNLLEAMCNNPLALWEAFRGRGSGLNVISMNLVRLLVANKYCLPVLKVFCHEEIHATLDPNTIFRGNSLATKTFDSFLKTVGPNYLSTVLKPHIDKIYALKNKMEVDPNKADNLSEAKLEKNMADLKGVINSLLDDIFAQVDDCPSDIRDLFTTLKSEVSLAFPTDPVIPYTVVAGFAFLRFFCPCILNPKLFGLVESHPNEVQSRNLTLIAKTVQNLANLVEFGQKESFMAPMNELILSRKEDMKECLNKFSSMASTVIPSAPHDICFELEAAGCTRMLRQAISQVKDDAVLSKLSELDSAVEDLENLLKEETELLDVYETEAIAATTEDASKLFMSGVEITKFTSGGKPFRKIFSWSNSLEKVEWRDIGKTNVKAKSFFTRPDAVRIEKGCKHHCWDKVKKEKRDEAASFTIVTQSRGYCLMAKDATERDRLFAALESLLFPDRAVVAQKNKEMEESVMNEQ
eukprot:TRINITY_DN41506_c0_g1_i1.p1 TRINITY_DN41506_c0_g1~~TRINITY_DN41506_c0_g1_i1.p1  ORF type:complete len:768 (+),score=205.85 TRINITY_DN41506_c0_g1_i1:155-2458(+)